MWGTGEQMRDFIHIEDCVTGVLTTMDRVDDGDAFHECDEDNNEDAWSATECE